MPILRRRRIIRRKRRTTRWFAITPGSSAGVVSGGAGTYGVVNLGLTDRGGAYVQSSLVGSTIERIILDVQLLHTINNAGGIQSGNIFLHAGVFVDDSVSPPATIWDPNTPSGNFMERQTFGEEIEVNYAIGQFLYRGKQDGFAMHFDTKVKRKLRENDNIWMSFRGFLGGTAWTGADIGYTGRLLLAYP